MCGQAPRQATLLKSMTEQECPEYAEIWIKEIIKFLPFVV